jgi:outer membrane biosynthesis protein TonB
VDTVKKWKFKPAEKNGQPVPVQVTVEMKFQR